jgi:hypothetical protein
MYGFPYENYSIVTFPQLQALEININWKHLEKKKERK